MDFLVDGNAYLNVAISVVRNITYRDKSIGSKYYVNDIFNEGKYMLKDQVKIKFRDFCLTYFNSLIAPIGRKIDRVHLVFDSKSWRKEYIREFFKESSFSTESGPTQFEYKANRKKEDHLYLFFEYFQTEIVPVLIEKTGINYYRIRGTEGDDIIAYLCERLKTDLLIYTVDSDMKQLTYSLKKNIIVIYPKQASKHKKICIPDEFIPELAHDEEDNFFSLSEAHVTKSTINRTISTLKEKDYVEYVIDPVTELFTKIFRGDKKDNIPKMDKMTPTKTTKLIDLIKAEFGKNSINLLDHQDEAFINFVIKNISILNKTNDIKKLQEIRKHFIFNSKIIRLNSKMFPKKVIESLNSSLDQTNLKKFNYKKFTELKNNPTLI